MSLVIVNIGGIMCLSVLTVELMQHASELHTTAVAAGALSGAVVANSTRHWMAKMLRDGDTVVLSQKSTSQEWALWQFTIVAIYDINSFTVEW